MTFQDFHNHVRTLKPIGVHLVAVLDRKSLSGAKLCSGVMQAQCDRSFNVPCQPFSSLQNEVQTAKKKNGLCKRPQVSISYWTGSHISSII